MLGILAEPALILVLVGISLLAKAMLPLVRAVRKLTEAASRLQSGCLNLYNALIGILLVLILALALFCR